MNAPFAPIEIEQEADRGQRMPRSRYRVLVAEDDAALRTMIATTLRRGGCEVSEASDGAQLLAMLDEASRRGHLEAFQVIVSDVRMPNMSGIEVLSALRKTQRTTPVILVTGFDTEDTYATACELGAVAVLDKPIDLEQLRNAVLRAARSR